MAALHYFALSVLWLLASFGCAAALDIAFAIPSGPRTLLTAAILWPLVGLSLMRE